MLWVAAKTYPGRKRMQRRNEQENKNGEEKEFTIRAKIGTQ
jgi:hypothetical protein